MDFLLPLSGAIPALFLMWLLERFDSKRPEPRWNLRKVAIYGGLSTIPCIVAQVALREVYDPEGATGAFFTAYVSAAFTEESAKAIALFLAVWRHPAFDERVDGIVYATRAGLGFALVENIGYLFDSKSISGFIGIFVLRAILAVPGHAIYAGFMGYWAARHRFDGKGPGLLGGLAIAIFLHGTYDAAIFLCAVVGQDPSTQLLVLPLALVPIAVVFFGFLRLRSHAAEAMRLDDITHAHPPRAKLPLGMGFVLR